MKKLLLFGVLLFSGMGMVANAEGKEFYGVGNRLGLGLGVGTEGIGFDAAVSLTKYVSARVGVNFMPAIKINTDIDLEGVDANVTVDGVQTTARELYRQRFGQEVNDQVGAKASLKRTTFDVKFDFYPFPNSSSFFITGGLSFGGEQVVEATGYNETMKDFGSLKTSDPQTWQAVKNAVGINIDETLVGFDDNGYTSATAKVSKVRPYVGLGFGRLIPKGRVGFRFEIGAQFQGRPKLYDSEGRDILRDNVYSLSDEDKNDITKVLDYMKVYPVIKLSIRGRIL